MLHMQLARAGFIYKNSLYYIMYKLKNKDTVILSGYVRYRPIKKSFLLMINSRILSNYLKNLNKEIRCHVVRKENLFFLNIDKSGNLLMLRDKEVIISISGYKLLTKRDILFLKDDSTKFSFPIKIVINPKQFNIDKYYLYPDKDAAMLAYELEKLKVEIPKRLITVLSSRHDLEFNIDGKEIIIEITRHNLSSVYQANFKHQSAGGNVRAHVFDIYKECVTDKILNFNKKIGFVILQKNWGKIKHIKDIIDELKLVKCYILFIEFSETNWAKIIAKEIIMKVKNESRSF